MPRVRLLLVMIVSLGTVIFSASSFAQVYKWVDAQGKIHYTDTPPMPEVAKSVETKKAQGNVIESDAQPFATKIAAEKFPVSLYTFAGCGDLCDKAKALLDKRGIPYATKSTEEDKEALKKLTGDSQIPVLVVGNKTPRRGFEESAWNSLLDEAGYPKSNPLANMRKPTPNNSATQP
ncbi:hypothetical protein A7981_10030 [Methylovorus sp. MM2]|nr:hypothetical protein A7981_10030 [Methylovorus sp. MM2]